MHDNTNAAAPSADDIKARIDQVIADHTPVTASERARDLGNWLVNTLLDGVPDTMLKSDQYGTVDLQIMGSALAHLTGGDDHQGAQAAVGFYLLGKVSRIIGAIEGGRLPTEDDWWDAAIYSLFGLRLLQKGEI